MGETRAAVWVGSLDQSVDEEDLQLHFAAAGHIHSVRVMRDREQGYSRCFGFVNFERLSDAEKAANQYNGSFLKGKAIDVNLKTETRLALEKERQRHTWGGCANWVGSFDNFPHDKGEEEKNDEEENEQEEEEDEEEDEGEDEDEDNDDVGHPAHDYDLAARGTALVGRGQPKTASAPTFKTTYPPIVKTQYVTRNSTRDRHSTRFAPWSHSPGMTAVHVQQSGWQVCSQRPKSKPNPSVREAKAEQVSDAITDTDAVVMKLLATTLRNEIESVGKNSDVDVQATLDGILLTGVQPAVSDVKTKVEEKINEIKESLETKSISLDASKRKYLDLKDVVTAVTRIERDFAVSVDWLERKQPRGLIVEEKVILHDKEISIQLCKGSILTEPADSIICPASPDISGSKGVAKFVSAACGSSLQQAISEYIRKNTTAREGTSVSFPSYITKGKASCVIFAIFTTETKNSRLSPHDSLFISGLTSALKKATSAGASTVAIPALCNLDGFSVEAAAKTTMETIRKYMQSATSSLKTVKLLSDSSQTMQFEKQFEPKSRELAAFGSVTTDFQNKTQLKVLTQWKYRDGKVFKPHDLTTSEEIETTLQANSNSWFPLRKDRKLYKIDPKSMTQIDQETGEKWTLQRTFMLVPVTQATVSSSRIQWYYTDDKGKDSPYSETANTTLEEAFQTERQVLEIKGPRFRYDIHLRKRRQQNKKTGKIRQISRRIVQVQELSQTATQKQNEASTHFKSTSSANTVVSFRGQPSDVGAAIVKFQTAVEGAMATREILVPKHIVSDMRDVLEVVIKHYEIEQELRRDAMQDGPERLVLKGLRPVVEEAAEVIQNYILERQTKMVEAKQSTVALQAPAEWDPQDTPVELVKIPSSSKEFQGVQARMEKSMPAVRITRLHRIQNRWLWERYVQHKERLARKNGDDYVNEMCLFHGTRETPPQKIYFSEEGFDMRYSCGGSWGIGNYFAVNASYSDRVFSYVCKTADVKQLLMAKVLTGHSFASEVDKSLRKPPIMKDRRCQISGIEDPRYDTVTGVTRGCRVYITYSNDKAYPCYLITYKNRR